MLSFLYQLKKLDKVNLRKNKINLYIQQNQEII
jgi:hypothetical protein